MAEALMPKASMSGEAGMRGRAGARERTGMATESPIAEPSAAARTALRERGPGKCSYHHGDCGPAFHGTILRPICFLSFKPEIYDLMLNPPQASPSNSLQVLDGVEVLILAHERKMVLAAKSGDPEIVGGNGTA